jgi:tRNA G18 (ribose-2'-O)-methylase SpoU
MRSCISIVVCIIRIILPSVLLTVRTSVILAVSGNTISVMLSLLLQSQLRSKVKGSLSTAFSVSTLKTSLQLRTIQIPVANKRPIGTFRSVTSSTRAATRRRRWKSLFGSLQKCLIIKNQLQLFSSSSDDRYRNTGDTRRNTSTDNTTLDDVVVISNGIVTTDDVTYRKSLLHEKLLELDCFADETEVRNFKYVVEQSMIDPTLSILVPINTDCCDDNENNDSCNSVNNYNRMSGIQKYGKSTIKTCQTYYYPKTQSTNPDIRSSTTTLKIAATRTARQIEFLYQRHKAQQTQWIRNHDIPSEISRTLPDTIGTTALVEDDGKGSTMNAVPIRNYFPFVVVLDNLRSAQNVGSIYRTADATKCQQVITIGITPNPCNGNGIHKIQKSSLGAELFVPSQHFTNGTMALQYIYHTYPTYQIVCVETTSESIPYTDLQYSPTTEINSIKSSSDDCRSSSNNNNGMVFIFGNEVTGVDVSFYLSQMAKMNQSSDPNNDGASDHAGAVAVADDDDDDNDDGCNVVVADDDHESMVTISHNSQLPPTTTPPPQKVLRMIEIPMYGTKNSLNVAVCVSIILYEMLRQYHRATVVK